jgi:DNA-binding response OmpR family regulator
MDPNRSHATLLIVDDELSSRQLLADLLSEEGYGIVTASNGAEALQRVAESLPSLILLDWQMPGLSGIEVCRRLREQGIPIPILFVTGRTEEVDHVAAVMCGADHYITKPFSRTDLKMKVYAALRRQTSYQPGNSPEAAPLRWGPLEVDEERRRVRIEDRSLSLSPAEFSVLAILVRAQGRVVSRTDILEELWSLTSRNLESRTIDLHISHIRKEMGDDRHLIETVRQVGYRLRS